MDAASIEEMNKIRRAMGMKPLPVPGESAQTAEPENEEDAMATLEGREGLAHDNYRKMQEAEQAKRNREERAAAVKKARDKAQRFTVLKGKGIADMYEDDDLDDTKSWLKNQKKRQKKIEAARKLEEEEAAKAAKVEHTAKDLAGVKVAHDMASFLDGDDQVLTLKDTGVLENEDEGDELENLDLREQEKLHERLDLKKKKPIYDPNDIDETGERGILSQYDEEIGVKKKKAFTLDAVGTSDLADILSGPAQKRRGQVVDLGTLGMSSMRTHSPKLLLTSSQTEDAAPISDYLDASEVKIKKPKKKKAKSTRKRQEDEALYPGDQAVADQADQLMDIDSEAVYTKKRKVIDEDFVDDDDLQTTLAIQRKAALKKRMSRPEDIARKLREEAATKPVESGDNEDGLVIDEISEFVAALQAEKEEEQKAPKPAPVTAMEQDSEDEEMEDSDIKQESPRETTPASELPTTGVEAEKTVSQGMGATLALLKERNLIEDTKGSELVEKFRQKEIFLAELHRRMLVFDEEAKMQRERDRKSGRLEKMSTRDREEWQRQQNNQRSIYEAKLMDQLFREGYRPNVELRYIDEEGRSLDAKEAFKELSHQFHGKGSGKGKTDKRLKKLAEEKRKMSQSMLDASQNVGMSTAASHQGKKRKEAGVRLA